MLSATNPYQSHSQPQNQPHLSTSTSLISATMPGADPGFQKRGGGGVTYMNTGVMSTLCQFNQFFGGGGGGLLSALGFRLIQPVGAWVQTSGGGGVLFTLDRFNQWGGGRVLSTYGSLYLKIGRVPSTYMAILETTLLLVRFKLTLGNASKNIYISDQGGDCNPLPGSQPPVPSSHLSHLHQPHISVTCTNLITATYTLVSATSTM